MTTLCGRPLGKDADSRLSELFAADVPEALYLFRHT